MVTNQSTGVVRETTTSDQGFYRINELPLGSYTVIVEAQWIQAGDLKGHCCRGGTAVTVALQGGGVRKRF